MVPGYSGQGRRGEGFHGRVLAKIDQPASGPDIVGPATRITLVAHDARQKWSLQRAGAGAVRPPGRPAAAARIREGAPGAAAASAHTLKGSAVGIGAFKVARAVEEAEQAPSEDDPEAAMTEAVGALARAADEAKAEIAGLLPEPPSRHRLPSPLPEQAVRRSAPSRPAWDLPGTTARLPRIYASGSPTSIPPGHSLTPSTPRSASTVMETAIKNDVPGHRGRMRRRLRLRHLPRLRRRGLARGRSAVR